MNLTPAQQTTLLIFALLVVITVLSVFLRRFIRKALGAASIKRAAGSDNETAVLPGPWVALRGEVELSNRALNPWIFDKTRQLFLDYYASGKSTPAELTSEYEKEEFLLVVDEQGRLVKPVREMIERFHKTAAAHPEFRRWFRQAVIEEGELAGVPLLLAARWLCHMIGLRHGTVEIFIDPPDLPGHTLVQVRGMDKFEAPGAFDIPCAGHISGMDAPEAALEKELGEELNLSLYDLDDFRLVGRYNSYPEGDKVDRPSLKINNEHRVLYRARIKPEAAARIRFSDGEVAGLSVFSVSELRALVKRYPERVASGLSDAIGFYDEP